MKIQNLIVVKRTIRGAIHEICSEKYKIARKTLMEKFLLALQRM